MVVNGEINTLSENDPISKKEIKDGLYYDEKRKEWGYDFKYTDSFGKRKNARKAGFALKRDAKYEMELEKNFRKNNNNYDITLDQLYYEYLKIHTSEVLPTQLSKIERYTAKFIMPYFKKKKVRKITAKEIEDWQSELYKMKKKDGNKFKASYLNTIRRVFSAILNYGLLHSYIDRNPFSLVKPFKDPYEITNTEKEVWSVNEFQQFISVIDDEKWMLFFTYLWSTGLRIGEARGVQFKDIVVNSKTGVTSIYVNKSIPAFTKGKKYSIHPPKNKMNRYVEIDNYLAAALQSYARKQKRYVGWKPERFLFGFDMPLSISAIDYNRKKFIEASQVKYLDNHGFRHSHITHLLINGMDIMSVSQRVGHKDPNITYKVYAHVIPDYKAKIIEETKKTVPFLSPYLLKNEINAIP